MQLYSYWRSSAAYRVRIALNLKDIDYEIIPVRLIGQAPAHRSAAYRELNPQMLVPFLVDGAVSVGQSQAILEYLEETYPECPLLPQRTDLRAAVRAFCNAICCDIHPLNNLRVMNYLTERLEISDQQRREWYAHWIHEGFRSAELTARHYSAGGEFVFGDRPTLADLCLIPQMYNARRFRVTVTDYPTLTSIADFCEQTAAFRAAAPEAQPDAEGERRQSAGASASPELQQEKAE